MRWFRRLVGLAGLGALGYTVYRRTTGRPVSPSGTGTAQWTPLTPSRGTTASASTDTTTSSTSTDAAAARTANEPDEADGPAASKVQAFTSANADGAPSRPWIEPTDGHCPESHPVKANENSGIYHLPGGRSYDTTRAERCYCETAAAEADGFRAAKR